MNSRRRVNSAVMRPSVTQTRMNVHEMQVQSISHRALVSAVCGLSAFIALLCVQGLVGTILGGVLFLAAPLLVIVAVVLAAIELVSIQRGHADTDGVALSVIGVVCSILALLVFVWLVFWIAAA
jgi:hypothetical protein